ncbi:MAG: hypothetical protein J6K72_08445 [Clostridia bacterium]|nr:hypothetical protein [Clostridia bacterium]
MLIQMIGGEKRNVPAAYALRLLEQGKAVRVEGEAPEQPAETAVEAQESQTQPVPEAEETAGKELAPVKRKPKKETGKAE